MRPVGLHPDLLAHVLIVSEIRTTREILAPKSIHLSEG